MDFPFPFLALFLIFVLFLFFRFRFLNGKQKENEDLFWSREREASTTVIRGIDESEFVTIPLSEFPFGISNDPGLAELEADIHKLQGLKFMNLTGKTNTDLKLTYGVNNFDEVVSYGENYDQLMKLLSEYSELLENLGFSDAAENILKHIISSGCDLSAPYITLGKIYGGRSDDESLIALIDSIENSPLSIKNATRDRLLHLLSDPSAYSRAHE